MANTLTIVINSREGEKIYVNLEDGKVIGGAINDELAGENFSLKVSRRFKLCDYPYVELSVPRKELE